MYNYIWGGPLNKKISILHVYYKSQKPQDARRFQSTIPCRPLPTAERKLLIIISWKALEDLFTANIKKEQVFIKI